jgi:hypothetical protein
MLAYFEKGTEKGFYAIDFPNKVLTPGSFLIASSEKSPKYQDNYTINSVNPSFFNWNGLDLAASSASVTQYIYNGTSYTAYPFPNKINDVFSFTHGDLTILLLTRNTNGTARLVDGLIASEFTNHDKIQPYITSLPNLTVSFLSGGVSQTMVVNFLSYAKRGLNAVSTASGLDDGYFYCSSWDKVGTGTRMTPSQSNTGLSDPIPVTANVFIVDDYNVYAKIDGGAAAKNNLPVDAILWRDVDMNGLLDNSIDEQISTTEIKNLGVEYFLEKQPEDLNMILVLDFGASCYDFITLIGDPAIVLPVTFTGFDAQRNGSKVHLSWQTATETNNKGFSVQRKNGSSGWEDVAFIPSQAADGQGNSATALSYTFADDNNTTGLTQYRLHQQDRDGKSSYSDIRSVRSMDQAARLMIYPNPSPDGAVNVVFADASTLRHVQITDMVGRIVQQWRGIRNGSLRINNLSSGMYHIKVINATTGQQNVEKVMVR